MLTFQPVSPILDTTRFGSPFKFYPEDEVSAVIEADIERGLPAVAGLTSDLSQAARVEVLGRAAQASRRSFVAVQGDPFGCAVESVARTPAAWCETASVVAG